MKGKLNTLRKCLLFPVILQKCKSGMGDVRHHILRASHLMPSSRYFKCLVIEKKMNGYQNVERYMYSVYYPVDYHSFFSC